MWEVKLAYGFGQVIGATVRRRSVCDGELVHFGGYGFDECVMELMIAADEFNEEIEKVEAVENARLIFVCKGQNGKKRLKGGVRCTNNFKFLQKVPLDVGWWSNRGFIRESAMGCPEKGRHFLKTS